MCPTTQLGSIFIYDSEQVRFQRQTAQDFQNLRGLQFCPSYFKCSPWCCCEKYPITESNGKPRYRVIESRSVLRVDTALKC